MSREAQTPQPPYVAYATFTNFLNSLRDSTIPTRIDKTYLSGMSYGTQAALLGSLRYLGLVRDDKTPTARLEELALASDQERPNRLRGLLEEAYSFLWNGSIDLQRTTAGELRERFGQETSISGSTLDKAIAFFCGAAEAAQIELSPHLKRGKRGGGTGGTRRQRSARRKPRTNQQTPNGAGPRSPSLEGQLLGKFPSFDPAWPDELKAQWFEGFKTLMGMVQAKPSQDNGEPS